MTSAKYYRADSSDTLNKIYDDIDRLEKTDVEVKKYTQYQELFPWAIISGTVVLLLRGRFEPNPVEEAAVNLGAPQMLWLLVALVLRAVDYLLFVGLARAPAIDHAIHFRPAFGDSQGWRVRDPTEGAHGNDCGRESRSLVLALARPQWGFTQEEARQRGLDLIMVVDTSNSMLAGGMSSRAVWPARNSRPSIWRAAPGPTGWGWWRSPAALFLNAR